MERDARPEVHIAHVKWSVDCDHCGVLDDCLSLPEARKIHREHRDKHCRNCGYLLTDQPFSCTQHTADRSRR